MSLNTNEKFKFCYDKSYEYIFDDVSFSSIHTIKQHSLDVMQGEKQHF